MGEALTDIWQLVKRTVETVNQEADTVARLSSATPFLDAFGHVVYRVAVVAPGSDCSRGPTKRRAGRCRFL